VSYQSYRIASFGLGKGGLSTVGYQLFDSAGSASGSRITAGVADLNSGQYGALVTFPDGFRGRIRWDSGEATPIYLSEEINPQEQEYTDVRTSTRATPSQVPVSGGTTVTGTIITVLRGDTATITFSGIGSLVGRSKLWFTVKDALSDSDADAILQIEETAGLLRLNGAAGTAGQATTSVTDATNGDVTFTVEAAATAQLAPHNNRSYDVQVLIGSTVITRTLGTFKVPGDVTRATS